jgi:hypothetical protein
MTITQLLRDLPLAGGDDEKLRDAYEAFWERDTANRTAQYDAAVERGLPRGKGWRAVPVLVGGGRGGGGPSGKCYSSWRIFDEDDNQVSLTVALQREGLGDGGDVRARVWTEEMYDKLEKYLAQKKSSDAIATLMKVGRTTVESKIREKGLMVWRGRGKSGRWEEIP